MAHPDDAQFLSKGLVDFADGKAIAGEILVGREQFRQRSSQLLARARDPRFDGLDRQSQHGARLDMG